MQTSDFLLLQGETDSKVKSHWIDHEGSYKKMGYYKNTKCYKNFSVATSFNKCFFTDGSIKNLKNDLTAFF